MYSNSERVRDGRVPDRTIPITFGLLAASLLAVAAAWAADHAEAPLSQADPAADIADVYAWHDSGAGTLTTVVTFDGRKMPTAGQRGTYDRDVLYTIHIDNDGDYVSDIQVRARFVRLFRRDWVLVKDLPGSSPFVFGPVEHRIRCRGRSFVYAGLRDDPFFFDLEGFQNTLMTGDLSFDANRDSFAGTNATSLVLEMDLGEAIAGGSSVNVWATTGRTGGAQ